MSFGHFISCISILQNFANLWNNLRGFPLHAVITNIFCKVFFPGLWTMSQISIFYYDNTDLPIYRHAAKSVSPFALFVKKLNPFASFLAESHTYSFFSWRSEVKLNCWGRERRWGDEGGNGWQMFTEAWLHLCDHKKGARVCGWTCKLVFYLITTTTTKIPVYSVFTVTHTMNAPLCCGTNTGLSVSWVPYPL